MTYNEYLFTVRPGEPMMSFKEYQATLTSEEKYVNRLEDLISIAGFLLVIGRCGDAERAAALYRKLKLRGPKMKHHRGLQTHRFKNNPEEKRFADAWLERNKYGNHLAHLLDERSIHGGSPPTPSDRDYVVAATVVQWLGSPVGQIFLRDLGYEKAKKKKEQPLTPH